MCEKVWDWIPFIRITHALVFAVCRYSIVGRVITVPLLLLHTYLPKGAPHGRLGLAYFILDFFFKKRINLKVEEVSFFKVITKLPSECSKAGPWVSKKVPTYWTAKKKKTKCEISSNLAKS